MLASLDRRAELWTGEVIDPEGQLLALFDVLDDWFHQRSDYEACSFVKVLIEMGAGGRIGQACLAHLDKIRDILPRTRRRSRAARPQGLVVEPQHPGKGQQRVCR